MKIMTIFKLTFINLQCNTEIKMVHCVTLTHFIYDHGLWKVPGTAVTMTAQIPPVRKDWRKYDCLAKREVQRDM